MTFIDFRIIDAVDILLVALLLWWIYRAIRGTAALTIFAGIFVLYLLWIVVRLLNMELLSMILGNVLGVGALALVVVFQQEIRRYLLMIGKRYDKTRKGFFNRIFSSKYSETQNQYNGEIVSACFSMSSTNTGALIAIEKSGDLDVYATTGDKIDAQISKRLLENLFFKNSPLHDGAVIIKNGRIYAARCVLPSSDNPHLPAHLGMRHRAAIGLTEHSDAVVIAVSEETGTISVIEASQRTIVQTQQELLDILDKLN